MRLHIGAVPADPSFEPESDGWIKLREPRFGTFLLESMLLGLLLAVGLIFAWWLMVEFKPLTDGFSITVTPPRLLLALLAAVALIVAHELLHAVPALIAGSSRYAVVGPDPATRHRTLHTPARCRAKCNCWPGGCRSWKPA